MKNPEKMIMTDGSPYHGMLMRGATVFKAKKHRGVQITYEEIDLEEYDKRVDILANKIAEMPDVDLLVILKDALYDLSLDTLSTVEKKLNAELEKPVPEVTAKTEVEYRGTCVNLVIGGKKVIELRH